MKYFLSADDFLTLPKNSLLIADCRYDFSNPTVGRELYLKDHVPGAVFVSLDEHLCAPLAEHGGRHPLPPVDHIAKIFGWFGIERGRTRVVAYDDSGGVYASRFLWMLLYLGHDMVHILDGGYSAYKAAGGEITSAIPSVEPKTFLPDVRSEMLATMADVANTNSMLIDCRAPERFTGENETIDRIGGHIPSAINLFWQNVLTTGNKLRLLENLRSAFEGCSRETIFYCGSGVTACVNVLAMEEALGFRPRLYAGSWSDWISYPDNPIA